MLVKTLGQVLSLLNGVCANVYLSTVNGRDNVREDVQKKTGILLLLVVKFRTTLYGTNIKILYLPTPNPNLDELIHLNPRILFLLLTWHIIPICTICYPTRKVISRTILHMHCLVVIGICLCCSLKESIIR